MEDQSPDTAAKAQPTPRRDRNDHREHERLVRRYLWAIEAERTPKGRKRPTEMISSRILKIEELLVSADPLTRLHLTQERLDLHGELMRTTNGGQTEAKALEADFIKVAKNYGTRTGITFAAWRQVGVDAKVLEKAGINKQLPPSAKRPAATKSAPTRKAAAASDDGGAATPTPEATATEQPAAAAEQPAVSEPTAAPEFTLDLEDAPAPSEPPAPHGDAVEGLAEEPAPVRRRRVTKSS